MEVLATVFVSAASFPVGAKLGFCFSASGAGFVTVVEVGSLLQAASWEGRGALERVEGGGAVGGDRVRAFGGEGLRWEWRWWLERRWSSRESCRLRFGGGERDVLCFLLDCRRSSSRWLRGRRSGDRSSDEYLLLALGLSSRGLLERRIRGSDLGPSFTGPFSLSKGPCRSELRLLSPLSFLGRSYSEPEEYRRLYSRLL